MDTAQKKKPKVRISILVVTYRSDWAKVKATLDSVIRQHIPDLEIVIADDGSEDNHKKELTAYFAQHRIQRVKLVLNPRNRGTVRNMISGLEACEGEWVKDLGPGDLLNPDCSLMDWIQYNEKRDFLWSFSDAVYYRRSNERNQVLRCKATPCDIRPYLKNQFQRSRWNYVVLEDISIGAVMLCRTEVYLQYCRRIAGRIIYAEDNVWRLMMFDGIRAGYYPRPAVLYEYGEGSSTARNSVWYERIQKDWKEASGMMFDEPKNPDAFQRKMIKGRSLEGNRWRRLMMKGRIRLTVLRRFRPRWTAEREMGSGYGD